MRDSAEETDRGGTPRATTESTTDLGDSSGDVGSPVRGRPAGEAEPDAVEGETPDVGTEDTTATTTDPGPTS